MFKILAGGLPFAIRELYDSGRLVIGEVGGNGVRAHIEDLGNGDWVIEVYSGMAQFIYSVARTLCAAATYHSPGSITAPTLTRDETIEQIAEIFRKWQQGAYNGRFHYPRFAASKEALDRAHELSVAAETFFLAHEIGHIALDMDLAAGGQAELSASAIEAYADRFAIRTVLKAAQPLGQVRMPYAGALFAMRIFSFLEIMGAVIDGPHPVPHVRLQLLIDEAKALLGKRTYNRICQIALAVDEYMESVENTLRGKGKGTESTVEKIRVGLWAVVEELARGRLERNRAMQDFSARIKDVPDDRVKEAAEDLCESLFGSPGVPGREPANPLDIVMAQKLVEIVNSLSEPVRSIFLHCQHFPKPLAPHAQP